MHGTGQDIRDVGDILPENRSRTATRPRLRLPYTAKQRGESPSLCFCYGSRNTGALRRAGRDQDVRDALQYASIARAANAAVPAPPAVSMLSSNAPEAYSSPRFSNTSGVQV